MGCLCPANTDATTMKFESNKKHVRTSQNDQLVSLSRNSQQKSRDIIGSQMPAAAPSSGPYNRHPDEVQTNHTTELQLTENLMSEEQKQEMAADPFGRHMSKMYGDRYSMIRDRDGTFAGSDNSGKRLTVLDSA